MQPEEELLIMGLRHGWPAHYYEMSSSMVPVIRPGDRVRIVPGARVRLGDIVLCQQEGYLLLHRVVARSEGRILTKGDTLNRLDAPVNPQDILGRAVHRQRHGRVQPLDSFPARFCGLAFALTVPWISKSLQVLATLKRWCGKSWAGPQV